MTKGAVMRAHSPAARGWLALGIAAVAFSALCSAQAQPAPRGLLAPGDAAVTGFSGALPPIQIPPGIDPNAYTFIDPNGASLRVIDLQDMQGPADAQLVPTRAPFAFPASLIGQVFGVTLDNQVPPNIYVSATSAYGLPIVAPQPDGTWTHVNAAAPSAAFMPGLWGGADPNGGAGSIWKVDGITGAVTLFSSVAPEGRANSGAALGNLAFDGESNTLFVSDRETGLIHRLDMSGAEIARYDHGTQARTAAGLPPVAFDPAVRLDITKPAFAPDQPATWNYAAPERRVYGLAVRGGRLFYGVAESEQVWSVAFTQPGAPPAFGDPTWELSVPPGAGPVEISKITFDDQGRMLLAERPDPTGAFDFQALALPGIGRVLRYQLIEPQPGLARTWQPVPDEYAVGFPGELRNSNGGLALGYDYERDGKISRGSCGGFLWMTGEDLRHAADPKLAEQLTRSGPPNVQGLQGNPIWTVRPMNAPPLRSYFLDADSRFQDPTARGHMGDMEIWRACGPTLRGGWMLPGWIGWWWTAEWGGRLPPPRLTCPVDLQKPGFQCCPNGTTPGPGGQCRPLCPNGANDPQSLKLCALGFDAATYKPAAPGQLRCIGGGMPVANNGALSCVGASPVLSASVCQAGWTKQAIPGIGTVCAPSKSQLFCPPGKQVGLDGHCRALCLGGTAWPTTQCCAAGSAVTPTGQCCPFGSTVDPKTGACSRIIIGCAPGSLYDPVKGCTPPTTDCPPGFTADAKSGQCQKIQYDCLPGLYPSGTNGECLPPPPPNCVPGSPGCTTQTGCSGPNCPPPPQGCPASWNQNTVTGGCCPPGQSANANGACTFTACPTPGKLTGGKCCSPDDLKLGGACAVSLCGAGAPTGASGACCPSDRVYDNIRGVQTCCAKPLANGKCEGDGPLTGDTVGSKCAPGSTDPACCPAGYTGSGKTCCLTSQMTSTGICCPAGQSPTGTDKAACAPTFGGGKPPSGDTPPSPPTTNSCCAAGFTPLAGGSCCAVSQLTSGGMCCPAGQTPDPRNRRVCITVPTCGPRDTLLNGACCRRDKIYSDAAGAQQCCAAGLNANGTCGPQGGGNIQGGNNTMVPSACAPGYTKTADGSCCANAFVKDGRCLAQGGPIQGPTGIIIPVPGLMQPPLRVPPPPPPANTRPPPSQTPPKQTPPRQTRPQQTRPQQTRPQQSEPARPQPDRPKQTRPQQQRPAERAPAAQPNVIAPILPGAINTIIRAIPGASGGGGIPSGRSAPQQTQPGRAAPQTQAPPPARKPPSRDPNALPDIR